MLCMYMYIYIIIYVYIYRCSLAITSLMLRQTPKPYSPFRVATEVFCRSSGELERLGGDLKDAL